MKRLTTIQAANIIDVDPSRIRRLLIDGTIRGEKTGRDWSINATSLRRYAEKDKHKGGRPRQARQLTPINHHQGPHG